MRLWFSMRILTMGVWFHSHNLHTIAFTSICYITPTTAISGHSYLLWNAFGLSICSNPSNIGVLIWYYLERHKNPPTNSLCIAIDCASCEVYLLASSYNGQGSLHLLTRVFKMRDVINANRDSEQWAASVCELLQNDDFKRQIFKDLCDFTSESHKCGWWGGWFEITNFQKYVFSPFLEQAHRLIQRFAAFYFLLHQELQAPANTWLCKHFWKCMMQ